jgi:hypothetical protein
MIRRLVVLTFALAFPASSRADLLLHVPSDYETIQSAITAAEGGDEIIVAQGTYNESIDFLGKSITVRSLDPSDPDIVATTVIDGSGIGAAVVTFVTAEGDGAVLEGFTITGGSGNPSAFGPEAPLGGGVYVDHSSPLIRHCVFVLNSAAAGGGLFLNGGQALVDRCIFMENEAWGASPLEVADGGGAIATDFANAIIVDCLIHNNHSTMEGGGISILGDFNTRVLNCLIFDNVGLKGGGLAVYGGFPEFLNCTIVSNYSVANSTTIGDGVDNTGGWGEPKLTNCVISNNHSIYELHEVFEGSGVETVIEYSFVEGGWSGAGSQNRGGEDGEVPGFVDPGVGDFRLATDSICIDSGDSDVLLNGDDTDLDGNPREVGCTIDMGAYEYQVGQCEEPSTDLNADGSVNVLDLLQLLSAWGACPEPPAECPADFNGSGAVDVLDLLTLLADWG